MPTFNDSHWAKPDFAQGFIEEADRLILERRRMMGILVSFYHHFLQTESICNNILELGCGDAAHTEALLQQDPKIVATLIDGSETMLEKAKKRLASYQHVHFLKASFQELFEKEMPLESYHLVFSSLAIHHLSAADKIKLFTYCYNALEKGGYFINVDVVLAQENTLEKWYLELWRQWIEEQEESAKPDKSHVDIPEIYKENKDNQPDSLNSQLEALSKIGFRQVDCFYKYGIFTVYGGKK